jgi:microcin C transport system ATP-binding protein
MSHKIAVMKQGDIVEFGDSELIFSKPTNSYTKTLLASALEI